MWFDLVLFPNCMPQPAGKLTGVGGGRVLLLEGSVWIFTTNQVLW